MDALAKPAAGTAGLHWFFTPNKDKKSRQRVPTLLYPDIILREKSLAQENTLKLRAEGHPGVRLQGDPPVHVVDVQQIGTRAVTDRNKLQIAGSKGMALSKSIHHFFLQISCDFVICWEVLLSSPVIDISILQNPFL